MGQWLPESFNISDMSISSHWLVGFVVFGTENVTMKTYVKQGQGLLMLKEIFNMAISIWFCGFSFHIQLLHLRLNHLCFPPPHSAATDQCTVRFCSKQLEICQDSRRQSHHFQQNPLCSLTDPIDNKTVLQFLLSADRNDVEIPQDLATR